MNTQKKQYQLVCWICHQLKNENIDFQPCLCKGTMSFVHQNCIDQWATEKYASQLTKDGFKPNENVQCPNCKYVFDYSIIESRQFSKFSLLRLFDSIEKIKLLMLILVQLIVLSLDMNYQQEEINSLEKPKQKVALLHYIHMGTVFILLAAAIYNIIEMTTNITTIKIKNRQNTQRITKK